MNNNYSNCYAVLFWKKSASKRYSRDYEWFTKELNKLPSLHCCRIDIIREEDIWCAIVGSLSEAKALASSLDEELPISNSNLLKSMVEFGGYNACVLDIKEYDPQYQIMMFNKVGRLYSNI
jgi:hypothetical protein